MESRKTATGPKNVPGRVEGDYKWGGGTRAWETEALGAATSKVSRWQAENSVLETSFQQWRWWKAGEGRSARRPLQQARGSGEGRGGDPQQYYSAPMTVLSIWLQAGKALNHSEVSHSYECLARAKSGDRRDHKAEVPDPPQSHMAAEGDLWGKAFKTAFEKK